MATEQQLMERAGAKCELCGAEHDLSSYSVPASEGRGDADILICGSCNAQLAGSASFDANHWQCLRDSMWSPVPAVQVMAYRLLKRASDESWATDLLEMLYLDDELSSWAQADTIAVVEEGDIPRDCNGVILQAGDTVTITKDLDVKGSSLVAKRGTHVRNISLTNDPTHIEGRVDGQKIYIKTCFVKKA